MTLCFDNRKWEKQQIGGKVALIEKKSHYLSVIITFA